MSFCITGYPRSRTAWFAAFFTTDEIFCHHEIELIEPGEKIIGYSGANYALQPKGEKTVIIERDKPEAIQSLSRFTDKAELIVNAIDLNKLDGLRVKFVDIDERLKEIWEYCVDIPFPVERAEHFKNFNIQQNYRYLK